MLKSLSLLASSYTVAAGPPEELVTNLWRMNNGQDFDYNMWSGYINIPKTTKEIHYMMVESQSNPAKDPLIVWFNGGPGCSSMLAFIQEHGPWLIMDGSEHDAPLTKNEFSWNLEANILYIEQPAGVGYSWCDFANHPEQCSFDDNSMAADNVEAIVGWYDKFPEFKTNDLWISGESYAGIYVPFTVNAIHHHNAVNQRNPNMFKPPLKGMMVGNGVTSPKYDSINAYMEMAYYHSLYPGEVWEAINSNGCTELFEWDDWKNGEYPEHPVCQGLYNEFSKAVEHINVYNIIGTCWGAKGPNATRSQYGFTKANNNIQPYKKFFTAADYTPWRFQGKQKELGDIPPCVFGQELIDYFNDQRVKDALHIKPEFDQIWALCANTDGKPPQWSYESLKVGSQWVWEGLKGQYRMLKFSGDVDGAVPTTGTIKWVDSMNRKIIDPWRAYHVAGRKAPAGYIIEYDGMTLATVHGAGHMCPQFKPAETYHLIFNWLKNKPV